MLAEYTVLPVSKDVDKHVYPEQTMTTKKLARDTQQHPDVAPLRRQRRDVTVRWSVDPVHTNVHGPLARYVKLRVARALGMPGTFSPPPRVFDPDMHHSTCRDRQLAFFLSMRNPQSYVSGKRPMPVKVKWDYPDVSLFVMLIGPGTDDVTMNLMTSTPGLSCRIEFRE